MAQFISLDEFKASEKLGALRICNANKDGRKFLGLYGVPAGKEDTTENRKWYSVSQNLQDYTAEDFISEVKASDLELGICAGAISADGKICKPRLFARTKGIKSIDL